jgi:hypothetical protein
MKKKDGRVGLMHWHLRTIPLDSLNCAKSGQKMNLDGKTIKMW